jgi:hypothetical protein
VSLNFCHPPQLPQAFLTLWSKQTLFNLPFWTHWCKGRVIIAYMAGMLQEEHPFIKMYIFVLKIYLVHTFSWIYFSTIFNGTCFFGSIMDLEVRKCWKNFEGSKRVSKIAYFLGKKRQLKNYDLLSVKRTLLSFPQFLYPVAIILHRVAQWTQTFPYSIDQPPKIS